MYLNYNMKKKVFRIISIIVLMLILISNILPTSYAVYEELVEHKSNEIEAITDDTTGNNTVNYDDGRNDMSNAENKILENEKIEKRTEEDSISDFNIVLNGIYNKENNDNKDLLSNLDEKIEDKGIYVEESSREYLIEFLNSLTNNAFKIDDKGFLQINNERNDQEHNEYVEKIEYLINQNRCTVISLTDKYKVKNNNEIINIKIEDDDYALLFKNENEDESISSILLLNSNRYNKTNNLDSKVELLEHILECFKEELKEMPVEKIEENNDEVEKTDNESKELIDIDEDDDFNLILKGMLYSLEKINDNTIKEDLAINQNGIWIEENSRKLLVDFLNNHGIYTYSVDKSGYLQVDKTMKDNPNLDFKAETEVDMEIQYILKSGKLLYIKIDNKYLTKDNTLENKNSKIFSYQLLKDEEYVKSFDDEKLNRRIVILNSKYFTGEIGYNVELSDRFVKYIFKYEKDNNPPLRSDTSKYGYMTQSRSVYFGPSSNDYATVGSVDYNEQVYILGKCSGWYHIQYHVGNTGKQKSGFVPTNTVTNIVAPTPVHEEQMTGGYRFANSNITIYSCDDLSIALSVGTVFSGEGVTLMYDYLYSDNSKSYNISYVEYSTSSGTKRGYTYSSNISSPGYVTSVARILSTSSAYSGPDTSYVKLGGAYYNEYVSILQKEGNWVFVEYNTTSGRKRGFMKYENMSNCNYPSGGYADFSTFTNLKKATQQLTVYGGPNTNYANIGTIFNQEIVSYYTTERNMAYVEYSTANGAKRGYVNVSYLTDSNPVTIPTISTPANFTSGVYGYSGLNQELKYYKMGNGQNVLFAVFAQHGWEDAWAQDGIELVNIADRVMQGLSSATIGNWTIYVIPYANPDGITNGYTNNGPGRCTVTTQIDMNRSWPANFTPFYTSRNYTGSTAMGSPEGNYLKSFLENNDSSNGMTVLLDIHGWLDITYGDYNVGKYFNAQFGNGHSSSYGSGYLETWGNYQGYKSCLVELPMPSSSASIISNNYSGKLTTSIINLLGGITVPTYSDADGTSVNEQVIVNASPTLNVRSQPNTSSTTVATLNYGTIVTRIIRSVTYSNGYTWDKISFGNGSVGYVASDYLELASATSNQLSETNVRIIKAYCRINKINSYTGTINGSYDNDIYLAVKELQRIHELPQTGYMDENDNTWNAIELNDTSTYNLYNTVANNYTAYGNGYGPSPYYVPESDQQITFSIETLATNYPQQSEWNAAIEAYDTMSQSDRINKAGDMADTEVALETIAVASSLILPHGSDGIVHYLGNTGSVHPLTAGETQACLNSSTGISNLRDTYTQHAKNAIESMLTINGKVGDFSMSKALSVTVSPTNLDWFSLLGHFNLSMSGQCFKAGNSYSMAGNYKLKDFYDFDTFSNLTEVINRLAQAHNLTSLLDAIDDVAESRVGDLHYAGEARFYYTEGSYGFDSQW